MKDLKYICKQEFLLSGGYLNIIKNIFISIFKPLVLIIRYVFKYIYVMMLPILPIKNKNYDKYYSKKQKDKLQRRRNIENNFVRFSKY